MMKTKLIEDVLPPIIYRPLLRIYLLARGLRWHRFYGCYPTIADVPSDPDGQNSDWYAVSAAKHVENLKAELSRRPMGDNAGLLLLPLAVSQLLYGGGATVTVLDFGGGPAKGLQAILEHVPNLDLTKFRYILVETPAMCRAVRDRLAAIQRERFGGATFIEVEEAIPASVPRPLIVNARASLHYLPDYRAVLSQLLSLAPEIFIVAHTPVTDAPTYAQEQRNQPHRVIARWIINRTGLISEIEKSGYRLSLTFDHDLPITYKKSPGPISDASMVFHRLAASNYGKSM